MSSAYAISGISSNAALWEYGQETAAGGGGGGGGGCCSVIGSKGFFVAGPRPRLSFDTSDGSDVKSVLGVPTALTVAKAEEERASAEEEVVVVSVKGEEGGVI